MKAQNYTSEETFPKGNAQIGEVVFERVPGEPVILPLGMLKLDT